MKGERFLLHGIANEKVFVAGRKSTLHPIYRNFISHPVDLVGEALMNPIMVAVQLLRRCFERNLSINPYFIILACDAKNASSSTTIKYELVFEEHSQNSDFTV
jgi:hypothetical protein